MNDPYETPEVTEAPNDASDSHVRFKIKLTIAFLVLSAIFVCLASYFEGLYSDGIGVGVDAVWLLIIAWMIWDLCKKKNINLSLYGISLICLFFISYDYIEYGMTNALLCYITELLFFAVSIFTLRGVEKDYWVKSVG